MIDGDLQWLSDLTDKDLEPTREYDRRCRQAWQRQADSNIDGAMNVKLKRTGQTTETNCSNTMEAQGPGRTIYLLRMRIYDGGQRSMAETQEETYSNRHIAM
eukprot:9079576-Pyramimonas_sp.AAC.1